MNVWKHKSMNEETEWGGMSTDQSESQGECISWLSKSQVRSRSGLQNVPQHGDIAWRQQPYQCKHNHITDKKAVVYWCSYQFSYCYKFSFIEINIHSINVLLSRMYWIISIKTNVALLWAAEKCFRALSKSLLRKAQSPRNLWSCISSVSSSPSASSNHWSGTITLCSNKQQFGITMFLQTNATNCWPFQS